MKDLYSSHKPVLSLLKRYHLVLFTVVIAIILSISILLLYGIVNKASGVDSTPPNGLSSNFDQTTIDRINDLKTSDQSSEPLDLSQRRINPFGE